MTLERHRSKLIPDVNYTLDGQLFVRENGGTFPLKRGSKERVPPVDFRSYDPKRDKKRKFSQRQESRYEQEIRAMSGKGTWSTATSSRARKLRRNRGVNKGSLRAYNTVSDTDVRRKRGSLPKAPNSYVETMQRAASYRKSSQKGKGKGEDPYFRATDRNGNIRKAGQSPVLFDFEVPLSRRISEERLPGVIFLVTGVCLLVLGAIRLVFSHWMEYGCGIWTGSLSLLLGVAGLTHNGDYLRTTKSGFYIFSGVLTSCATMVSTGFVLHVMVPMVTGLALQHNTSVVNDEVTFTNNKKTLVSIDIPVTTQVYLSLVIDCISLLVLLVNNFSLTATVVAISNHWDAVYGFTSQCDHRGSPRWFNPLEQMTVGQATLILGLLSLTLQRSDQDIFWSPAWSLAMVMVAGFGSLCYGKRRDVFLLGLLAVILQMLELGALGATIGFSSLAMVKDIEALQNGRTKANSITAHLYETSLASTCGHGLCLLAVIICVVYSAGVLFRDCKHLCCGKCFMHKQPTGQATTL